MDEHGRAGEGQDGEKSAIGCEISSRWPWSSCSGEGTGAWGNANPLAKVLGAEAGRNLVS